MSPSPSHSKSSSSPPAPGSASLPRWTDSYFEECQVARTTHMRGPSSPETVDYAPMTHPTRDTT
jgi:hypothetical protein